MIRIDKVYTLKNWSVVENGCLHGFVYGHHRFEDGKEITTSTIVKLENDKYIRTYSGSLYELDYIDENYEKLFPDAKNRLFISLLKRS